MMKDILKLMRIKQWYKNLVVFLPIIFLVQFFDVNSIAKTILAFFSLCLVSSTNYIINDIIDRKKDRVNPEKKNRAIASGKISVGMGICTSTILLLAGFLIGLELGIFLPVFLLFLLGQIYSFWLKKEAFIDVIIISTNFVIRAVAGSIVLDAPISPWLVLCTFFLALFLVVGKRESEIQFLGKENSHSHREVLGFYTKEITNTLMIVSTTALIVSYALYSFLSNFNLLWTIPFALYVIFRYSHLIYSGSVIARHPELVLKDKRMVIGTAVWVIATFLLVYVF
jgi:4-hydroxybenzoate polyprenyltransferase